MRKHSGMRPQDIVIILKIIAGARLSGAWKYRVEESQPSLKSRITILVSPPINKTIASSLRISESEVSESLRRSAYAGLVRDAKDRIINKKAVFDFMRYGLKYVFPARPGALVRGVPTAQSALPLNTIIVSEEHYVWEYEEGTVRGQLIEPLYPTVPGIVENDPNLYEMLALADAIRTGSAIIESIASEELEKPILSSWGDM